MTALAEIKDLSERSRGHFDAFLKWCERDSRCERFSLGDLLVRPLQRLTRYPLLLRAVLKGCDADDGTTRRLGRCVDKLNKAIEAHNTIVQENENNIKLRRVQEKLR
jgi:pleckstrin domain-containing family G protein 5